MINNIRTFSTNRFSNLLYTKDDLIKKRKKIVNDINFLIVEWNEINTEIDQIILECSSVCHHEWNPNLYPHMKQCTICGIKELK